jgi:hypothetical protein
VAFYVGKAIRLACWGGTTSSPSGGYRNQSGTLYDPSAPALRYRLPGANTVTVSAGSLTRDGVGLYSYVLTPTIDGDAMATFVSADGAYAEPLAFEISPAPL